MDYYLVLPLQLWFTVVAELCLKEVDLSNFFRLANAYPFNNEHFS